ncbi:MAG: hypothetical protein QXS93_04675 [Candidatus Micrarchaeia archaeon]
MNANWSYLLILVLFSSVAFAVGPGQVQLIEPVTKVVSSGDIVDGGLIGPGQTLSVMVSTKVDTGGKYGEGGNWNNLKAESLPPGWQSTFSEYGPNLKINIKAPASAPEGKYRLVFSVNDEGDIQQIGGKVVFYVDIEVRDSVVDMSAYPRELVVQPGSPARFTVKIVNPSSASDVFTVEGKGITGWRFKKDVFVPARGYSTIYYELINNDEETIPITLTAVSKSSSRIHDEQEVLLITKSNPLLDIMSTKYGLLLYPPAEFLLYSTIYFVSSFM